MNKIIKAALTATFPTVNIDVLLEIINATKNPVIATEKLIGVYEKPFLYRSWKRGDDERVLVDFVWNEYNDDQVKYSYQRGERIVRYFTFDEAAKVDELTSEAAKETIFSSSLAKYKSEGECNYMREYTRQATYHSSCSIEAWVANHYSGEEDANASRGTMI